MDNRSVVICVAMPILRLYPLAFPSIGGKHPLTLPFTRLRLPDILVRPRRFVAAQASVNPYQLQALALKEFDSVRHDLFGGRFLDAVPEYDVASVGMVVDVLGERDSSSGAVLGVLIPDDNACVSSLFQDRQELVIILLRIEIGQSRSGLVFL
jgi:hypothetical protein